MSKNRLTITQIAELAFVSRSVVSRVLNNHANVSEEARARVLKVIHDNGYRPNAIARGLAKHRTYEVEIVVPRWRNDILSTGFWSLIFLGVTEQCAARGYTTSLSTLNADEPAQAVPLREFDGHILIHKEVIEAMLPKLIKQEQHVVLVGQYEGYRDISSVDVDNELGGYLATKHLVEQGRRQIAILLGKLSLPESVQRLIGYRRALKEAGLSSRPEWIIECEYSQEDGFHRAQGLVRSFPLPDGVFCASDVTATGAIAAFHDAGIRVPEELAIVGFDNLPTTPYLIPPLTTIHQPIYEKGRRAADKLINLIEEREEPGGHTMLQPELIVRKSCGAK